MKEPGVESVVARTIAVLELMLEKLDQEIMILKLTGRRACAHRVYEKGRKP